MVLLREVKRHVAFEQDAVCLLIWLKSYYMQESGAQGRGAGDLNLGGGTGEVGALKCGVLGTQSEGDSTGRRGVRAGGCHGDEVFWAESR